LKRDFNRPDSPTIATEFCGTSITSKPPAEDMIQTAKSEGPHIKFATGSHRGYTVMTVTNEIFEDGPSRLVGKITMIQIRRIRSIWRHSSSLMVKGVMRYKAKSYLGHNLICFPRGLL